MIDSLAANDCHRPENVMGSGTSTDLGGRAVQSHDDLPVFVSTGQEMNHFGGDVSTIEIREY